MERVKAGLCLSDVRPCCPAVNSGRCSVSEAGALAAMGPAGSPGFLRQLAAGSCLLWVTGEKGKALLGASRQG